MPEPPLATMGELFAGIGGFSLGFRRAGFQVRWQVETDSYCRKVLRKNFPEAVLLGDVRECGNRNLELVDVVCGGDPCQANANASRAYAPVHASLGDEFLRIVAELRPRLVVRENPTAVRADAPWPWWRFRAGLERLGYAVLPFRFRACCAGADFRRDRLFLLAGLSQSQCPRLEGDERQDMAGADDRRCDADTAGPDRWSAAPRICRGIDGVPHRVDRLRALGNAVVPQVAEWIAKRILWRINA